MLIGRRSFLAGLVGTVAAPYVVRNSGLLMPVQNRLIEPVKRFAGKGYIVDPGPKGVGNLTFYPFDFTNRDHLEIVEGRNHWPSKLARLRFETLPPGVTARGFGGLNPDTVSALAIKHNRPAQIVRAPFRSRTIWV